MDNIIELPTAAAAPVVNPPPRPGRPPRGVTSKWELKKRRLARELAREDAAAHDRENIGVPVTVEVQRSALDVAAHDALGVVWPIWGAYMRVQCSVAVMSELVARLRGTGLANELAQTVVVLREAEENLSTAWGELSNDR